MMNEVITAQAATALQAQGETIRTLYGRFIDYLDCSPKTVATYTRALRQFINWIEDNSISRPQREDVINWRAFLKETGHKANTIQSYLVALRQFFQWTADEGLYPEITRRIKRERISDEIEKDYLTPAQFNAILDTIPTDSPKGRRDYAIFYLMGICGLRCIEITRVNIEDLQTKGDKTILKVQGKGYTNKQTVIIPPTVEKAIRTSLADRKGAKGTEPLFTSASNNNGSGRLSTRSVSRLVKDHMKNAGYDSETLTAHSLRHTAVTTALIEKEDLQAVQQMARHGNINTTLRYAHNLKAIENTCTLSNEQAILRAKAAAARESRAAEQFNTCA